MGDKNGDIGRRFLLSRANVEQLYWPVVELRELFSIYTQFLCGCGRIRELAEPASKLSKYDLPVRVFFSFPSVLGDS